MGVQQQILHGARAQLMVAGKIVGCFTSCQWGVNYDAVPSFILGRYSPAEITYTGQDAISVTATGFRIVDNGAYKAGALPQLQNLMTHEDIALAIFDRQTQKLVLTVVGVRPTGYSAGTAARAISDFSVNYLGMRAEDESGSQGESAGASNLLSGT
jgi:hypothetical protein